MTKIIIIFCIAIVCSFSSAAEAGPNGSDMLKNCKFFIEGMEGIPIHSDNKPDMALCAGFIQGYLTAIKQQKELFPDQNRIMCPPISASAIQYAYIIVNYLNNHPELLHISGLNLSATALFEKFKCK